MSEQDPVLLRSRARLWLVSALFALAFASIALRLVEMTVLPPSGSLMAQSGPVAQGPDARRADILDRNGELLATNIQVPSIFADPQLLLDRDQAARKLAAALDGVDEAVLRRRLAGDGRFVWIKRHVTAAERERIGYLGLPGVDVRLEERRVYPKGALASHVVGFTDIDNQGLTGIELAFDEALVGGAEAGKPPLVLSLDTRVQQVVREELQAAMTRFRAKGGNAMVLDRTTGEVLSMVSLPDFDPNHPEASPPDHRFNRNTRGTYEMGSLFKVFTIAMALESGAVRLTDSFDATEPLRIGRHTLRDYRPRRRTLTVPEIFMFSSNVGTAKMALAVGAEAQQDFLRRVGMFERPMLELPERALPLLPQRWPDITTATVAYGHGIAVTPMQVAEGIGSLIGDGLRIPSTLQRREPGTVPAGVPTIDAATAEQIRWLMWLTVAEGTGSQAKVPGYLVGGKTGTADKAGVRGYRENAVISSFVAAFPIHDPRYVVLVMLDEPHGDAGTYYFRTGGWTATPAVGNIIARAGPILAIAPDDHTIEAAYRDRLVVTETVNGRTMRRENAFAAVSAGR